MKIIEIDLTDHDPDKDLENFFANNPLEAGDHLKILVNDDPSSVVITSVMIYSIATILLMKSSNKEQIAADIFERLQSSDSSLDFISQELEEETGISIDVEPRPSASRNPQERPEQLLEEDPFTLEDIQRKRWTQGDHYDFDVIS